MNKRNYILEAMKEGKSAVNAEVICGAVKYYADLISEAIFPMSKSDTMCAIIALETIAGALREKDETTAHSADFIKLFLGSNTKEFNGKRQDMEAFHRDIFKNAPK